MEIIIVIIIIGILATLGFTQYTKVMEKARSAEAKKVLGEIRTAQGSYKLQHGNYASSLDDLSINAPDNCIATHYFNYIANNSKATATDALQKENFLTRLLLTK